MGHAVSGSKGLPDPHAHACNNARHFSVKMYCAGPISFGIHSRNRSLPHFLFPNLVLSNNSIAHKLLNKTIPTSLMIRYTLSHAVSMLLANIFIFLSAISLQGIILALAPPRLAPAVSRWVRFFCLVLLLSSLFCLPRISSVDQLIHSAHPIVAYIPPVWFLGVYEVVLGSHDAAMWGLAGSAVSALMLAGVLSILTYALCYRRFLRRTIESGGGVLRQNAAVRRAGNFVLNEWFLRKSIPRASYHLSFLFYRLCRLCLCRCASRDLAGS